MNNLLSKIEDLEKFITLWELESSTISKGTVGWHIEHSLLTLNVIIEAMKNSNDREYKYCFKLPKWYVLTFGKIPRGRAEAPKVVQPNQNFDQQTLTEHIKKSKVNVSALKSLKKNNYFNHPYFGMINLKPSIKY